LSIVICYRVLHCSQRATPALGLECYADKFLISMSVEEITTDLHQSHHDTRLTVKRSLASSNRISPIPRSTFVAVICLDRLRSSSDAPAPRSSATAGPSEPLRSSHRSILPGHRLQPDSTRPFRPIPLLNSQSPHRLRLLLGHLLPSHSPTSSLPRLPPFVSLIISICPARPKFISQSSLHVQPLAQVD
jgi:hypothetical protein